MLNSFKALRMGDLDSVDPKMLYPLLRWCSGSQIDLPWCAEVNKTFFWLPPEVAKGYISIGLRDGTPYIKYPKATKKDDDKTFDLKKVLCKRYFGWSEQEFWRNASVIDHVDFSVVADALGVEDKERKLLGIMPTKKSKR
jgi:hypothetical protein